MGSSGRFQFGLSSLFAAVTVVAILCSMSKSCPDGFWRLITSVAALTAVTCVLVIVADAYLWIKQPGPRSDAGTSKLGTLLRSPCFWMLFYFAFVAVVFLNILPYYRSYGVYVHGDFEVAGWPLHYWTAGGGIVYTERVDVPAIFVDVLAAITLPAATGIAFRNGPRLFFRRTRILLRKLLRKARDWRREGPSPPSDEEIG